MLVVVPYVWRCTVTLQESNLFTCGGNAGRPLCRAGQQNGRPSATYASHSCHSCVRLCVCVCVYVCVHCCWNWDNVSPLTNSIVAEEGEQPAHLPAHRVMTQRWRSYGRYFTATWLVRCFLWSAASGLLYGVGARWAVLKCRLLATFKFVAGLRKIRPGNSC